MSQVAATRSAAAVSDPGYNQLVEHFFRHETGRLHATLIRLLGVQNLSLAEDVAQEAMLRALRAWSMGGIPANPSAWITRVAMNLARASMPDRSRLDSYYLLHAVVGELQCRLDNHRAAAESFRRALQLSQVGPEQDYLTRMLERTAETETDHLT